MIGSGLLRLFWCGGNSHKTVAVSGGGMARRHSLKGYQPDPTLMQSIDALVGEVRALLSGRNPDVHLADRARPSDKTEKATSAAAKHAPLLYARDDIETAVRMIAVAGDSAGSSAGVRWKLDAMRDRAAELMKIVADQIHEADMVFVMAILGEAA